MRAYREYSPAPTDDLLDFGSQRSKVTVMAGCRGGECIYVDAEA